MGGWKWGGRWEWGEGGVGWGGGGSGVGDVSEGGVRVGVGKNEGSSVQAAAIFYDTFSHGIITLANIA